MRPFAVAALLLATLPGFSYYASAQAQATAVKDPALLKAPLGKPLAIVDFEDLECPACSHAFPLVHQAADHYKIPIVRHDFPLQMHLWSRDAAITARYIQDKISPGAAEDFRGAVFQNQASISSKDDLQAFTQKYFQQHGRAMPFVMDPTGQFAREVQADYDLGVRVGLNHTPSIFVVTQKGYTEVLDVSQLFQTIDTAQASLPAGSDTHAANSKLRHPNTVQR
jgi:protein-disulfide isomerase